MKEFIDQLERITEALKDPEYLFLVLEPLQIWGVAFGLLGLVITYFLKNEKLQVASLIVITVSALSVLPYLQARKTAQTRIEKVFSVSAPSRAKGFHANTADRLDHRWLYLALAGVAGAAILVGPRRNQLGFGLAIGSVAFSLYAINYGLWMHYQDSLAYHPNLKQNEAPVKEKIRATPAEESAPKPATVTASPISKPEPPPKTSVATREIRPLAVGTR
ncbi:MAG: hypothetical protein KDN20_06720 [Verrucomicrobiae bacterium]|nr:hypothetical protein [Verrucomicrobiae bacterium]